MQYVDFIFYLFQTYLKRVAEISESALLYTMALCTNDITKMHYTYNLGYKIQILQFTDKHIS